MAEKVIGWYNQRHSASPLSVPEYAPEDFGLAHAYPDRMPTEQLAFGRENGAGLMDALTDAELEHIVADSDSYPEGIRVRVRRLLEFHR